MLRSGEDTEVGKVLTRKQRRGRSERRWKDVLGNDRMVMGLKMEEMDPLAGQHPLVA